MTREYEWFSASVSFNIAIVGKKINLRHRFKNINTNDLSPKLRNSFNNIFLKISVNGQAYYIRKSDKLTLKLILSKKYVYNKYF